MLSIPCSQATFMPQTAGFVNNTLILTSRLPLSFQDFDSSTFIVTIQVRIMPWHCHPGVAHVNRTSLDSPEPLVF